MNRKNMGTALLLALLPGCGHAYWGKYGRAALYGLTFWIPFLICALTVVGHSRMHPDVLILLMLMMGFIGVVNFIDMAWTLLNRTRPERPEGNPAAAAAGDDNSAGAAISVETETMYQERFRITLLSIIPGLGHFQLGLMQRGLAFLGGFFGLFALIVFLAAASNSDEFLVLLAVLPIVWIYSMADAVLQVKRKHHGEALIDRTVFEDFQDFGGESRKSKVISILLGIFPGAGHLYLGLQRRGLQLMAGFLAALYILDEMRLSVFLFLLPILWFYSFFDVLGQVAKLNRGEELEDVPVVSWLLNHQKWVGIGLLALGLYYLTDQVVLSLVDRVYPQLRLSMYFRQYAQTFILSVLFIGGGLKLLAGNKKGGK